MKIDTVDVMWPEKVKILYKKFPWLRIIFPEKDVGEIYVKRFEEDTLEIQTETKFLLNYLLLLFFPQERPSKSIFLVDSVGNFVELGKKEESCRLFIFWWGFKTVYFNESVRQGLLSSRDKIKATYVVCISHNYDECPIREKPAVITFYKPPQNAVALEEWLENRINEIGEEIDQI